jgi:hypothetical protein
VDTMQNEYVRRSLSWPIVSWQVPKSLQTLWVQLMIRCLIMSERNTRYTRALLMLLLTG